MSKPELKGGFIDIPQGRNAFYMSMEKYLNPSG